MNEICRVVLRRSESELLNVLKAHLHLINEPNGSGLTPLHLSIGWPSGIQILLDHGAEVEVFDRHDLRPLDHAILRACLTSLTLLEKTNRPLQGLERALSAEKDERSNEILDYLINMEVNRRKDLQSLVLNHLPRSLVLRFLAKDRLLDAHAVDTVIALKQHNVQIPASLSFDESRRTVYHLRLLERDVAESLWNAGFRDINEPDCNGDTPLMQPGRSREDFLELVDWFEEKGVKTDDTVQHIHSLASFRGGHHPALCSCLPSGHTVMHVLANRVSINLFFGSIHSDWSRECFQRIVINEKQDKCKCACSSAGCRAVIIIIKPWIRKIQIALVELGTRERWILESWLFWLLRSIKNITSEEIILDVIRFLTFDTLGLTHTCCRQEEEYPQNSTSFEDEDAIREIHDEEQEDLQLLEDLLSEFEQYRRRSNCCIRDFYFTYWRVRMKQVLSEETISNQDDLREIGVSLHSSEPQHPKFLNLLDICVNNGLIDDEVKKLRTFEWVQLYRRLTDDLKTFEKSRISDDSEYSEVSKDSED